MLVAATVGILPTRAQKSTYELQKDFADWRFGMFMHFEMGTYTEDEGWSNKEHTAPWVFNPTKMQCNQWADAAKSAGMTFAILTTRHHYGFSLWPTKYYDDYNISHSPHKQDILKQYVEAFRAKGIKPCFYYSIWDKHHAVEKGSISADDMRYLKGQITELLTNYGEIPLLIIDGWAWRMGHNEVSYGEIRSLVKKLQPNCLLVDHNGLTEMWEGDAIYFEEPKRIFCPEDNKYASCQGMTITDGWFWFPSTPKCNPLSTKVIVEDHLKVLEKRYCNFILNCPINRDGLLDSNIVARLREVGQQWKPNYNRAPLPPQAKVLTFAVTPKAATATSGKAANAVDGICDSNGAEQPIQSLWETSKNDASPSITLDLGAAYSGIDMLTYLPRQHGISKVNTEGNITHYTIEYSTDNRSYKKAASGEWKKDKALKQAYFKPVKARYIRLKAQSPDGFVNASEIGCGSWSKEPIKAIR